MAEQDIRSKGRPLQVAIRDLRLDPHNPRLPAQMQGEDQEELAVHLELAFEAWTVAESIASHGFFGSEPLIVVEEGGVWVVVEGNRRLTALLGLSMPAFRKEFPSPDRWDTLALQAGVTPETHVPVVVLPDRAAATPIIGFRHISGILQWQPYAQARYIARLVDEEDMSFKEVAEMIGVDRTKVGNLYRNQAITSQARRFGIDTGPLEQTFSLLEVAMNTVKLRDHVGADIGTRTQPGLDPVPEERAGELREVITWLYGDGDTPPVIGESRDISKLGNVVASVPGLAALRSGRTLAEALQEAKEADFDPRQRLMNRLRAGRNALLAADEDVADFTTDREVVDAVNDARAAVDSLLAALGDA